MNVEYAENHKTKVVFNLLPGASLLEVTQDNMLNPQIKILFTNDVSFELM